MSSGKDEGQPRKAKSAKHAPEELEALREMGRQAARAMGIDPEVLQASLQAKQDAEIAAAAAADDDSPPWDEDVPGAAPVVHEADTSYAQVRLRVLDKQPPQLREYQRKMREPKPPPSPAQTVVNGLTGETHVVPLGQHQAPTAPRRKTSSKKWCSECLRYLTADEKKGRTPHKHDPQILIKRRQQAQATQVGDGKAPRKLNSRHKPAAGPRKQSAKFQGMAGYLGPR